jgi:hypothetical protein
MKRAFWAIALAAALLSLVGGAYAADVVPCVHPDGQDPANEIDNHSFAYGADTWQYSSESVFFNAGSGEQKFGRDHVVYDPGAPGSPAGWIRQVVDNRRSPDWHEELNHKIVDMSFWVNTTDSAPYVKVGFDWWDVNDQDKPLPGSTADHEYWLADEFRSVGEWKQFDVTFDWASIPDIKNRQPRWISIEFAFYGCSGQDHEAAVEDIVLHSKCVPEPSSMLAFAGGLFGFFGYVRRRRS